MLYKRVINQLDVAVQMTLFAPKIFQKKTIKLCGKNHSIVLSVNRVEMFLSNHWVFEGI